MTEPTTWPQGVIARYLNQVGATVDVARHGQSHVAACTGCPRYEDDGPSHHVHDWAQAHAATCRALPRPGGA